MVKNKDTGGSFGRVLPVILILLLLGIFMSLYFFKYVPEQQNAFNGRGFMELGQIEKAVQSRNQGYIWAIETFLAHPLAPNPLIQNQHFKFDPPWSVGQIEPGTRTIGQAILTNDSLGGSWRLTYPLFPKSADGNDYHTSISDLNTGGSAPAKILMSIALDTILAPIINTYQDIFDDYLLIGDTQDGSPRSDPDNTGLHQGEVVYNSGNLAVDYRVNTDSLLKKSDGFSLLDIHNVTIEGNPYKLFIYPFKLGKERIILAGLVSVAHYNAGYKDIPFTYIGAIAILVLLLFIHLPVLKIYILGSYERITDLNIRMIIGTYFVAAFVVFFLFSRIFLVKMQSVSHKANLDTLSGQVQQHFDSELDHICTQLDKWDNIYATKIGTNKDQLQALRSESYSKTDYDSSLVDHLLQPDEYPFPEYAFWIDSRGKWTAGWSAKKNLKSILLLVADRQYFKDFLNGTYMTLRNGPVTDSFIMQPLLSKLDGEYTITVVKRAVASQRYLKDSIISFMDSTRRKMQTVLPPQLVGLSTKMASVTNVILPTGYNFSIIDENGDILYDARPGRALLSNILQETGDPSALRWSAHFHSQRYFSNFTLKGQQVALLATPMPGLPYTLLTYYKLSGADDFQMHLILLSSLFAGAILLLLIISTLINEWSMKKPSLLQVADRNFAWLRPTEDNNRYYGFLILGMALLLGIYMTAWMVIEQLREKYEFSLFYLSLLFPFYIALYYFRMKEKKMKLPLLLFLILVIVGIHAAALPASHSLLNLLFTLLITEALFTAVILVCVALYERKNIPFATPRLAELKDRLPGRFRQRYWLMNYSLAIVTGVFMIIIVPACGVFWLFLRQETVLQHNSARLNTGLAIAQRNLLINQTMATYKFFGTGPGPKQTAFGRMMKDLKFRNGIYLLQDKIIDTMDAPQQRPDHSTAAEYDRMHRVFFPYDSTELAWTDTSWRAKDASWRFVYQPGKPGDPHKEYFNRGDRILEVINPNDAIDTASIKLKSGPDNSFSSFKLIAAYNLCNGIPWVLIYFGCQGLGLLLIYWMTISLARRIFLLRLFNGTQGPAGRKDRLGWLLGFYAPQTGQTIEQIGAEERFLLSAPPSPDLHPEESIIKRRWELDGFYRAVWNGLSAMEKFVLYDFAGDGFTNYKNGDTLYSLYDQGLIFYDKQEKRLAFLTLSFREWILQQCDDPDISSLIKQAATKGPWQSFKLPLLILVAAFGLFIFFTQDAIYQKIAGLIASGSSIANMIIPLLKKANINPASGDQ
jgi:hypothetical protein